MDAGGVHKMKKLFTTIAITLALVGSASAAKPEPSTVTTEGIQRAAKAVSTLRSMMLDPDSFVLEKVQQDRFADKHPDRFPIVCYQFRSHNAMGGYGGTGYAWMDGQGKLRIFDRSSDGEMIAAGIICDLKHPERNFDITAKVKAALAPPASAPVSPEDAAKKAQQYADCLKAAVDNPSIVCK
jgi:hypothetical protein